MKTIDETEPTAPVIHVSPSPHLVQTASSTRRMMVDVMIALAPVVAMSLFVFRGYALFQLAVCLGGCLLAELLFVSMRGRASTLKDGSAIVTGVILAMSLPGTAPWYVGAIAAFVAIGIGKIIFGGVGMNLFNPAMVGRAFVMISFAGALAASGFEDVRSAVDAISQATPMNAYKMNGVVAPLNDLFWGTTNGSLGETSAAGGTLSDYPAHRLLGDPRRSARCRPGSRRCGRSCRPCGRLDGVAPDPGWFRAFRSFFHRHGPGNQSSHSQRQTYFRTGHRHVDYAAAAFLRLPGRGDVCRFVDERPDAADQPVDDTDPLWRTIVMKIS